MATVRSHAVTLDSSAADPVEIDADLVARVQQGDTVAFTALYRRYAPRVYGYAAWRLGGREAAEDATQVVFMRVATSLRTCRDGHAFGGWLFAIARNVVSDAQRARMRSGGSLAVEFDAVDPDPSPEEHLLAAEAGEELRAARERCLNPGERELFDLLLTDLNDKEIAAVLGKRHGAIRTAHWRLLTKLRRCFEHLLAARGGGRHEIA